MIHSSQWIVSGSGGYYLPRWPILLCSSVFFPLNSLPEYQCCHLGSHGLKMARQDEKDLVLWYLFGQQPPRWALSEMYWLARVAIRKSTN